MGDVASSEAGEGSVVAIVGLVPVSEVGAAEEVVVAIVGV